MTTMGLMALGGKRDLPPAKPTTMNSEGYSGRIMVGTSMMLLCRWSRTRRDQSRKRRSRFLACFGKSHLFDRQERAADCIRLSTHITRSSTSVPRNRVFASYAKRCGTERVPPLNPASFGKLVRIIFPGIQTRRLGVRGESKYHYVELALIIDDGEPDRPCVSRLQSMARDSASRRGSVNPVQSRSVKICTAPASTSGRAPDHEFFFKM